MAPTVKNAGRQRRLRRGGRARPMPTRARKNPSPTAWNGKATRMPACFRRPSSDVDLAYQILESVELGVTTVDHYFDTLGGISRAVKRAQGRARRAPCISATRPAGEGQGPQGLKDQVALGNAQSLALQTPSGSRGCSSTAHEGVRQIEAQGDQHAMGWSATPGRWRPLGLPSACHETVVLDEEMRRRLASASTRRPRPAMANRLIGGPCDRGPTGATR